MALSHAPTFCSQTSTSSKLNMPFGFKRLGSKKDSKPSISSWGRHLSSRKTSTGPATDGRTISSFPTTTPTRRPKDLSDAAPPAYSPPINSATIPGLMQLTEDSPYAFLTQFDTIFLIDDSGSMAGRSWRETAAALAAIAPICTAHDADGIDIYFLNRINKDDPTGGYTNITTTAGVERIFKLVQPAGGTPTGTRLHHILKPYLAQVEESMKRQGQGQNVTVKPLNIIVITDGVASDEVESVIVKAAQKLDALGVDPWQVGIQFFQVGHEPKAAEDLQELDDALSSAYDIRDIVDTVPWSGDDGQVLSADGILKVVLGSIVKKLDRRRGSDERLRK